MEPALNMLDRALHGDSGALSFLEKTASIYILDATNASAPTTYGCWDFLNQALSEVERFEQTQLGRQHQHILRLEGHVQLLCTMSRKAARRSPYSDRRLIGICLSNAAVNCRNSAQALIDLNCQTRERVMGRIAAMAFDFSFHRQRPEQYSSAFANPVAMESLCAIIAANSISNGPAAVRDFVLDWIIPSMSNFPPFAVASVVLHLAVESMGNGAPAGTEEILRNLSAPIITKVIGPLLTDSLRESDVKDTEVGDGAWVNQGGFKMTRNQRLAAVSMRALERWCASTSITISDLNQICSGTKIIIAEVISDSLYSHAESIIDAAAELLDTLLITGKQNSDQIQQLRGSSADAIDIENRMEAFAKETNDFLVELVSAVGLQRFRFIERQSKGDTAVCRCLTRIASTVAIASQSSFRANQLQGTFSGIVDLLLKAAAHPSVLVCGLALEALPLLILPRHSLSENLLPILQQKVVYPLHLLNETAMQNMDLDHGDTDFQEFNQFREDCVVDTLTKCYLNNPVFYLESCMVALERLCATNIPSSQSDVYQMEGVLFCLRAVSTDASKIALLVNAGPAAQAAAARAFMSRRNCAIDDIEEDSKRHNDILVRCVLALTKAPPTSNPLVLSQMCQFIGKYAIFFSKTPTSGVLDSAAELALMSFTLASNAFRDNISACNIMKMMQVSPFAQAATALRDILCRSPSHFATPQVLTALAGGWETSYVSANSDDRLSVEDREALCNGICTVLASLPSDQLVKSLNALSRPTIDSLEIVIKKANDILAENASMNENKNISLPSILKRGADEIRLLTTMTKTFNDVRSNNGGILEYPSLSLLRGSWPCLIYLAEKYSSYDIINEALGNFLTNSLSFQEDSSNLPILIELCDMASTVLRVSSAPQHRSSLTPMLHFVKKVLELYGRLAELDDAQNTLNQLNPQNHEIRRIIERLMTLSIDVVSTSQGKLWMRGQEQQNRGQNPVEGSPEKIHVTHKKKSLDALAALLDVFTAGIKQCPVLVVQLGGFADDESFFQRAIAVAISTMSEKELEIARASMIFLNSVVNLRPSRLNANEHIQGTKNVDIGATIDNIIGRIRSHLMQTLINGVMGNFPRDSLDSAAALLHALLIRTDPKEIEVNLNASLRKDQFLLGNDALNLTLQVLGECTSGKKPLPHLMNFFSDLWDLYQVDDAGGIAGGNVVKKFERKYSNTEQ